MTGFSSFMFLVGFVSLFDSVKGIVYTSWKRRHIFFYISRYLQIWLDKSIIEFSQPRFDRNYSLLTVLKLLMEDDRSTIKQHCFHFVLKKYHHIFPQIIYVKDCTRYVAVVVVIVWKLDIQLHVQSLPIATNSVNSNPVRGDVYSIQH